MSGRELAVRSKISQSKISKIECGHIVPTADDVRRIGAALRLSGDVVHRLVDSLSGPVGGDLNVFRRWVDLELNARRLDGLAINGVPPLLQTSEYLLHLLRKQFPDSVIVEAMHLRLKRQAERFRPDKRFRFLISEPALLRFSDTGAMWRRQIEALSVDAELFPDQVRTLPADHLMEMWLIEDFTILDGRATHEMPDLAHVPYGRATSKTLAQRFEQAWNEAEPAANACRRLLGETD